LPGGPRNLVDYKGLTVRARLQAWLDETHSTAFELRRHFLLRFFDSEFVSSPGQWRVVMGGAIGILASLILVFAQAYFHKYAELSKFEDLEPYQLALVADLLFFATLAMLMLGLFTTLQWPALFPGLRDYLALAALPVRMREVFTAKFQALLAIAVVVTVATTILPSLVFPAVANLKIIYAPAIFLSFSCAGLFVFLSLVAFQGVLLNLLPIRQFSRVSLAIQGIFLSAFLCALPFVFSIPNLHQSMKLRPDWALAFPPVWFLGQVQFIVGDREPFAIRLAAIGAIATIAAAGAALLTYFWSYRRHRKRVIESPSVEAGSAGILPLGTIDRLLPNERRLAVFVFIAKMLRRSRQHRLILTAYIAIALAIIFEGFVSLGLANKSWTSGAARQVVIAAPLALSLFLLAGLRYLFRLPIELRANWVFRIHEPGRGTEMLEGMERFVYFCALLPVVLITLPLEMKLLGVSTGLEASLLCALPSMILVEFLLFRFERVPFTSSYLPGQRPLVEVLLDYAVAAIVYVWTLSIFIRLALGSLALAASAFVGFLVLWWWLRRVRLDWRPLGRLEFDEIGEPVVQLLEIDKD
jgi:hypothetical protein